MAEEVTYPVAQSEVGSRLDRFLAQRAKVSRHEAMRLIEAGAVRVGAARAKKGALLRAGDVVRLEHAPADPLRTAPQPQPELPLDILFADDVLVIGDKPGGQPSHPLRPGERGSYASALVARYPECGAASDPPREGGLCHRLDTHTSGALLAARDPATWRALRAAFQSGAVEKEYLALCAGVPPRETGRIDLPLLPVPGHPERMQVAATSDQQYRPEALDAETEFTVERTGGGHSLLRVRARTGRRHQIRVHLGYLGLPLVGDPAYGGPELPALLPGWTPPAADAAELLGQLLHAALLRFKHPKTGQTITVTAPLSAARQAAIDAVLARG